MPRLIDGLRIDRSRCSTPMPTRCRAAGQAILSLDLQGAATSIKDPLHQQAEDAVRRLEQALGRDYGGNSACLAASAACLAKENGLTRIDHVALSRDTGSVRQGENLFVVQGALNDPAQLRAHMRTDDALSRPVERSMAQLQSLNDTQRRQQAPQMAQPEQVVQQHRTV